jgi:outer membrane lipoprotein-sorting protein
MRHRGAIAAAALCGFVACGAPAARAADAAGDERAGLALLDSIETANVGLADLSAPFTETTFMPVFEESLSARGEVFFRKPAQLLLRYTSPDTSLLVVSDKTVWLHRPDMRQAHRFVLSEESTVYGLLMGFGGSFGEAKKHFRFLAADGARTRAGGSAGATRERVLRAVPRAGSAAAEDLEEILLVIDTATWLPARTRFREKGGDERTFAFGAFRRNQRLDASLFAFTPPPGTEVFDMAP